VLEKASAADPKLADIPYHLGIIYSEQGKKREAIAAFKKALKADSDFSNAVDAANRIEALSKN
jgi:tetratricopeptide (TPR) repeat protein